MSAATLNCMPARLYIVGRVWLETAAGLIVSERDLPSRQGRVLLVALAVDRDRPVTRDELAARVWPCSQPSAWAPALDALVSRLRSVLGRAVPGTVLRTGDGCHQLLLPADTVVDRETAIARVDAAEGALRRGDVPAAWAAATVATGIARRTVLAGVDGDWVGRERRLMHDVLLRALSCLHQVWMAREDHVLAARMAAQTIELEPFRETGYRQLMAAHAAAANRAEALLVYHRCRTLLADELGTQPSPETQRAVRRLLGTRLVDRHGRS